MKRTGKKVVGLMLIAALAVVTVLWAGMTAEVHAGTIKLSAADFHPNGAIGGSSYDGYYFMWDSGSITGMENGACLQAPIKFPSSATKVKSVTLYVRDESDTASFTTNLYGVDMATGNTVVLGEAASSGASSEIVPLQLNLPQKTLSKSYQYYLGICVFPDISFFGAKIVYVTP